MSLDFTRPARLDLETIEPVAPPQPASKQELTLAPLDLPELTESFASALPSDLAAPPVSPAPPVSLAVPLAISAPTEQLADMAAPISMTFTPLEEGLSGGAAFNATFPVLRLEPVVEQVARAYAEGHTEEALRTLEEQWAHDTLTERLWWMLFDLYRATGAQESFEAKALAYAEKFEKSPPAWNVQLARAHLPTRVAASAGGRASVTINGNLSARSAAQLEKLREVALTRSALRVDVAKIRNADQGGCQLLLDLVRSLKNSACELELSGAEDLASLIKNKLVVGQRTDEAVWLLLLELYQRLGLLDSFEETAVNYAITFEVSPPSWVAPKYKGASLLSEQMLATEAKRDAVISLSLSGELLGVGSGFGADSGSFSAISGRLSQAHPADPLSVDLSRLRRIDEASVMALRQMLAGVGDPRSVHLLNCSHLVAAMLEMAGITRQVVVETTRV